jgi:uncharacterized protein YdeI (YjbR/CyaY-like superfamily)
MKPTFFATAPEFRAWLEMRHDGAQELWVGFHKKSSGQASITWPEAVDEALCFGWIDGQRKGISEVDYATRFTPRKPSSIWSAMNVKRVEELREQGRMRAAGLEAFEGRRKDRSGIYSYEQRNATELDETQLRKFRANQKAWDFFQAQAPSYQKAAVWWVISARGEGTKLKRLARLIEDSEHRRTVPPLTRRTLKHK